MAGENPKKGIPVPIVALPKQPVIYAIRSLALLCLIHMLPGAIRASSVRQVTMKEMVDACELVFEGEVLAVESRLDPAGSGIHTYVTFAIRDVVKGNFPERTIQLSFQGGTVGDLSLLVSDMHMPGLGEKGVYFVETLRQRQVHPFYGWDQGHFLIKRDPDGTERIATRTGRKILGIESGQAGTMDTLSSGVALGVVSVSETETEKSLTVTEFKRKVRDMLRAAQ